MAFTVGLEALISADGATTDFGYLLNTSTKPYSASVTLAGEALDGTGFASTAPIAMENLAGLREWSGTFAGKYPKAAPASGHEGFVTVAGGYVLGCHSWTITASATEHDHSGFSSTPPTWKDFASGLYSFSGNYIARASDATALGGIVQGAAVFRASKETTNDNEIAGNILVTGRSSPFEVNGTPVIQYDFVGNGNMTFDGDSALFDVAAAGTPDPLVRPQTETITLRIDDGASRSLSGDAFLTGWTIGASLGSPVEVSGSFRGTGALTDA